MHIWPRATSAFLFREFIEDGEVRPLVLLRNQDDAHEVTSRWLEADVQFRPISKATAARIAPGASFDDVAVIFEANDVSLNTRLLYRKLHALARKGGCDFFLGYALEQVDGEAMIIRSQVGNSLRLEARKFVYSAGIGTKALFQKLHRIDLPIRYWKSHLVITKQLLPVGLFYVDPHHAAMMNHGDVSIVGFNEDALLCQAPNYEVIADRAANIRTAIRRLFPAWTPDHAIDVACTKVDFMSAPEDVRSLGIAIAEVIDGHICVLPGKMTEAPYLTDVLVSYLHRRLDDAAISLRPCDHFADRQLSTACVGHVS